VSLWCQLIDIANSERPHCRETWAAHRAVFRAWLNTPLREQAAQLRPFLASCFETAESFRLQDWEYLIPNGEMEMSCKLFMADLSSFFRILANRDQTVVRGALQSSAEPIRPLMGCRWDPMGSSRKP
jgi:hypothetical protein